jgi:hypothetical protein
VLLRDLMGPEELRARTKACEHCIDDLERVMYHHGAAFGYVRLRHEGACRAQPLVRSSPYLVGLCRSTACPDFPLAWCCATS